MSETNDERMNEPDREVAEQIAREREQLAQEREQLAREREAFQKERQLWELSVSASQIEPEKVPPGGPVMTRMDRLELIGAGKLHPEPTRFATNANGQTYRDYLLGDES